jgi:hypothetical protein
MVAEIDPAQFPHELIDVKPLAQFAGLDRGGSELGEEPPPLGFHGDQALPHRISVGGVVELEETAGDRTPSTKTGFVAPPQPPLEHRA